MNKIYKSIEEVKADRADGSLPQYFIFFDYTHGLMLPYKVVNSQDSFTFDSFATLLEAQTAVQVKS